MAQFPKNFLWGAASASYQVEVDYPTGQRIPKDSAAWYADIVRTNGSNL